MKFKALWELSTAFKEALGDHFSGTPKYMQPTNPQKPIVQAKFNLWDYICDFLRGRKYGD
ncbi:MAG: hypothetical protein FWE50_00105 [Alphaproteobacteria bacterium]|nr:hypothetical protein [Alphaproteobacteria bacterium]